MTGEIWVPILVNPMHVMLSGAFDTDVERVIQVKAQKSEPLTLKLASNTVADKVSVEIVEVKKGVEYNIKFKNIKKIPQIYNGDVKITTNYKEDPEIELPIRANLMAHVKVRPNLLNYGRISEERVQQLAEGGSSSMRRPLVVVANVGDDLKVEKVEVQNSMFKAEQKVITPGRMVQIFVEPLYAKLKPGKNEDMIKIYTNKKGSEVLEVPLYFERVQPEN